MRLNRKWILVIALVVSMATAISGTLAYLQDSATAKNTFTVGNVDIDLFEEGWADGSSPTLLPGIEIPKKPYIVNNKNDAWVWMKITVPNDLMSYIDWNSEDGWTMTDDGDADNDGYTIVTMKWPEPLTKGDKTNKAFTRVLLDASLKEMPEGLVNDNGTIDIVVDAYAIQSDAATSIDEAIEAYDGETGGEGGGDEDSDTITVSTVDGLKAALLEGKNIILANDLDLTGADLQQMDAAVGATSQSMFSLIGDKNVTIDLKGNTITADTTDGSNVWTIFYAGQDANLTVKNGRIEFNSNGRTGGTSAFTTFGSNSVITIKDVEVEQIGEGGVTQMIYAHGAPQDLGKIYVESGTYIQKEPTTATNLFYEQGGYNTNIIVSGGTYKVYHDVDLEKYMTIADGYKLNHIRTDEDGAKWYEVVPE